jgi:hypothetical protein
VAGVAAVALAVLVMVVTTPHSLGPLGVTAWFLLILIGLMAVIGLVAYGLEAWLRPRTTTRHRIRSSWRRGLLIGGYTTVILALNSLQQLNLRTALLLGLLLILVEFYAVARA